MAGIGCFAWFSRIFIIVTSFPFFIYGIMLIAASVWVIVGPSSFLEMANHVEEAFIMYIFRKSVITQTFGLAVLLLGVFVALIAFFGYCGSIFRSPQLLKAYIFCVSLLITMEILSVMFLTINWIDPAKRLQCGLQAALRSTYAAPEVTNAATVAWDLLFVAFHCCGVVNATDFKDTQFEVMSGQELPVTCCKLADILNLIPADPECPRVLRHGGWNERGCYSSIGTLIGEHAVETSALLLAILVLQIGLIVCSVRLKNSRKTFSELEASHL